MLPPNSLIFKSNPLDDGRPTADRRQPQGGLSSLTHKTDVDPRRWEPGEHTFTAAVALPADLRPGEYTLALWLPDPAETLRTAPHYAIRFANEGIWDAAHGWNVLGKVQVGE